MSSELQDILHEAYVKERKLNVLYATLTELGEPPSDGDDNDGFYLRACEEQAGGLELLQEINKKYGNAEIEATIMERLGESILQIRSGRAVREKLLDQILEYESQLVDGYKQSLRYLSADDHTRKMINRILTVKLVHKRDLLDIIKGTSSPSL